MDEDLEELQQRVRMLLSENEKLLWQKRALAGALEYSEAMRGDANRHVLQLLSILVEWAGCAK